MGWDCGASVHLIIAHARQELFEKQHFNVYTALDHAKRTVYKDPSDHGPQEPDLRIIHPAKVSDFQFHMAACSVRAPVPFACFTAPLA